MIPKPLPAPGNARAYLQQPCDDTIVAARPDLKVLVYPAISRGRHDQMGLGFVFLDKKESVSFDFDHVEQRFEEDCFPLLSQSVIQAGFRFELDSFTRHVEDGRGVIHFRMAVWRTDAPSTFVELGWLVTCAERSMFASHANMDYVPFEPWAAAWGVRFPLQFSTGCLHQGDHLVCAFRHSSGVTITAAESDEVSQLRIRLEPGRSMPETLEMVVPYESLAQTIDEPDSELRYRQARCFQVTEAEALMARSFDDERNRQCTHWASVLSQATSIHVPDPLVQSVYRTLTLNNVQFLGASDSTTALRPGQGGFNDFAMVYAWEASHYLIVMARQGFRQEVTRVLDYLLTTQTGHAGPEGDISDIVGCFRPHIHWMNETGAVLFVFSEYILASGDFDRLATDSAALLKAARWVQRQRRTTREVLPDGNRANHYGLLPKGRPHDWPIRGHFIFSDIYTWRGMDGLARAFDAAGFPDAEWLRKEADEYRDCILSAVRRSLKPHPLDPTLTWIPSDINEYPAEAIRTTIFCGPHALIGSGILASDDELIPKIEAALRAAGCLDENFAFRMRLMEDETLRQRQIEQAGGPIDLYYVTFAEASWYRVWLERGERAKAASFFNTTLAYSISRDLHLAHERYCPQLPWLLPWQPNASANGRILDMILRSLCYVIDETCYLLQGAPDRWFELREPLGLDRMWVSGSVLSFTLLPVVGGWQFSYKCQGPWIPSRFIVALPILGKPEEREMREVVTGGREEKEVFCEEMGGLRVG